MLVGLGRSEFAGRLAERLRSPVAWPEVLTASRRWRVAPLLYAGLRTAAAGAVPPAVLEALRRAALASGARSVRLEQAAASAIEAASGEGIPILLLKGPALQRLVYPRGNRSTPGRCGPPGRPGRRPAIRGPAAPPGVSERPPRRGGFLRPRPHPQHRSPHRPPQHHAAARTRRPVAAGLRDDLATPTAPDAGGCPSLDAGAPGLSPVSRGPCGAPPRHAGSPVDGRFPGGPAGVAAVAPGVPPQSGRGSTECVVLPRPPRGSGGGSGAGDPRGAPAAVPASPGSAASWRRPDTERGPAISATA